MNRYKYVKGTIQRRREWVAELKNRPCEDCGKSYPSYVMDFHHLNAEDKRFEISALSRFGRQTIEDEVAKCALLCANCHRRRHAPKE